MILRTVDLHVTGSAVLESRGRLVVKAWRVWRADLVGSAVAFQAKLAHFGAFQQLWIGGSVRRMADRAAFQLQRRVLKNERALLIRVTLHTGRVSAGCKPSLLRLEPAVGVVTVSALDHALQHLVMERLGELALHFGVTLDAQLRLILLEHLQRGDVRLDPGSR